MYCTNCGKSNNDTDKFCIHCGKETNKKPSTSKSEKNDTKSSSKNKGEKAKKRHYGKLAFICLAFSYLGSKKWTTELPSFEAYVISVILSFLGTVFFIIWLVIVLKKKFKRKPQ